MPASSRSGSTKGSCSPPASALTLSVREFELLVAMARRLGAIITREELYRTVWGGELRRRRPLGRRLREQAAQQARGRAARPPLHPHPSRLRLPIPTAAFTKCSHGGCRRLKRLVLGTPLPAEQARAAATPPSIDNPARGDVVIKNKMGALAGCRDARVWASPHAEARAPPAARARTSSGLGDDLRGWLDVRRAGLRTVGIVARELRPDRQLPGRRLGRRASPRSRPRPSTSAPATRR